MEDDLSQAFRAAVAQLPGVRPGQDSFLLAVSGGKDSVVLADLMLKLEAHPDMALAHCNFQLRGEASDGDEAFVGHLARHYQVPFFSKRFDTLAHARQTGTSVQVAARNLRYAWLEEVRAEEGYTWIVTAHHQQDSIETFLFHFARGTGLPGLTGIPERNGQIIRPLLPFSRQQVEDYYQYNGLEHREDATNAETKYARNKIRHEVLPVLRKLNPGFMQAAGRTIDNLQQTQLLWEWAIAFWQKEVVDQTAEGYLRIKTASFAEAAFGRGLLFELLRPAEINAALMQDLWRAVREERTGAVFISGTREILVNRGEIIVRPLQHTADWSVQIKESSPSVQLPDGVLLVSQPKAVPAELERPPAVVLVDAADLNFPLHVRRWHTGDRFQPLGMYGKHKKLKDFFTDQKYSRYDKENAWILVNGDGRIIWIVGERLDDRFRIKSGTRHVVELVFLKNTKLKSES